MKLSSLHDDIFDVRDDALISEAYGYMRTFDTRPAGYAHQWKIKKGPFHGDSTPHIMTFGSKKNHKGNNLVTGLNLNYLTSNEIQAVRQAQPYIQSTGNTRNPKARADIAKSMLPQSIIDKAMRTYDTKGFSATQRPTPGTITPDITVAKAYKQQRQAAAAAAAAAAPTPPVAPVPTPEEPGIEPEQEAPPDVEREAGRITGREPSNGNR